MSHYGFPRQVRLTCSGEFRNVFDGTHYKAGNPFFLILSTRNNLTHPRLGVIIAKKNVRKATQRNRIRRIIRESFRHKQHELGAQDLVVMVRRQATDKDNPDLMRLLDKLLGRLRRLNNEYEHHQK